MTQLQIREKIRQQLRSADLAARRQRAHKKRQQEQTGNSADALEKWVAIKGFEGKYEISDMARVRSLPRFTCGKVVKWIDGQILRQFLSGHCNKNQQRPHSFYFRVRLSRAGTNRSFIFVHKLVALAFIPNPKEKPEVNHKDGNSVNNTIDNLEWATPKENRRHATRILGRGVGILSGRNKLSLREVEAIKRRLESGESPSEISPSYCVKTGAIESILNRKTWILV